MSVSLPRDRAEALCAAWRRRPAGGRRLFAALVICLAASRGPAQVPPPVGGQFVVNSYLEYFQRVTDVETLLDGRFVVVWQSGEHPLDGDGLSVVGRLFDQEGGAETPEFIVHDLSTGEQSWAKVASLADGGFVVVWESEVSVGDDRSSRSVQARLFDSEAVPMGSQFQVNTYTYLNQRQPDVEVGSADEFLVVWESDEAPDDDDSSIRGRFFSSSGTPNGDEFRVNTETTYGQSGPAVARAGGEFVVAWTSEFSSAGDTEASSVQAKAIGVGTSAAPAQFQVNAYTTGDQTHVAIAPYKDRFVIAWTSSGSFGDDADLRSVQAVEATSTGTVGTEFQVNSYTTGNQQRIAVASDSSGSLLFAWDQTGAAPRHLAARHYSAPAEPSADQFPLDLEAADFTYPPFLASSSERFVATWGSDLEQGPSEIDIVARLFVANAIFADGFESGSTDAWSTVVP